MAMHADEAARTRAFEDMIHFSSVSVGVQHEQMRKYVLSAAEMPAIRGLGWPLSWFLLQVPGVQSEHELGAHPLSIRGGGQPIVRSTGRSWLPNERSRGIVNVESAAVTSCLPHPPHGLLGGESGPLESSGFA